jgi:hypothetical protein
VEAAKTADRHVHGTDYSIRRRGSAGRMETRSWTLTTEPVAVAGSRHYDRLAPAYMSSWEVAFAGETRSVDDPGGLEDDDYIVAVWAAPAIGPSSVKDDTHKMALKKVTDSGAEKTCLLLAQHSKVGGAAVTAGVHG